MQRLTLWLTKLSKLTLFFTVLEGPGNFAIKSIDGKATKEDIKAMKDLLANTFDFHETLETFSESCPLPEEKPQPVGPCAKRSCTN